VTILGCEQRDINEIMAFSEREAIHCYFYLFGSIIPGKKDFVAI
jgi:hypothetical protein